MQATRSRRPTIRCQAAARRAPPQTPEEYLSLDFTKKVLDLQAQGITELELDASAPAVQALILSGNFVANLHCLAWLPSLRVLHLDSCDLVDQQLQPCSQLQFLSCLVARDNRLQTLHCYSASVRILDFSANPLRRVSNAVLSPGITRVSSTSLDSTSVVQAFFSPGRLSHQNTQLADLQVSALVRDSCLEFDVRRLTDTDQTASVKLRCLSILPGLEVSQVYQKEAHPADLLRFSMPLSRFSTAPPVGADYAYPTDSEETPAFLTKLRALREEAAGVGRWGAVLVSAGEECLAFGLDLAGGRVLTWGDLIRILGNRKSENGKAGSGKGRLVDLAPSHGVALSLERPRPGDAVCLRGAPPGTTAYYFYSEMTWLELEAEVASQLGGKYRAGAGAIAQAAAEFNARSGAAVTSRDGAEYACLLVQTGAEITPVYVRLLRICFTHYNEPVRVPPCCVERFLVAQAVYGECGELQKALISQPVQRTSRVDSARIKVSGNVLQIQQYYQDKREFSPAHSYRIYRNEGLLTEQYGNYAVLNRQMAGLLTVKLQPRDEAGAFAGPEIESNAVYLRAADAADERLGVAYKTAAGAAWGP